MQDSWEASIPPIAFKVSILAPKYFLCSSKHANLLAKTHQFVLSANGLAVMRLTSIGRRSLPHLAYLGTSNVKFYRII